MMPVHYYMIFAALAGAVIFVFAGLMMDPKEEPKEVVFPQPSKNLRPYAKYYETKKARSFSVVGSYYLDLDPRHVGPFEGVAICEDNEYDEFAVMIFSLDGTQLGYTPKGNDLLSNSIKKWHGGIAFCSGKMEYNEPADRWSGRVKIVLDPEEVEVTKQFA